MVKIGLAYQWPNGVNPEKGGYDVGYQIAGIRFALLYDSVCTSPELRAALTRMMAKGADFELTKMDASGTITTEGSSRMGHENSRSGVPKVVGYKPTMQAFLGVNELTG